MRKIFSQFIIISFGALALTVSAAAQMTISGEVVEVIDGKTVVVAITSGRVKVELQYIDVPEIGQPLRETVTEHLKRLALGKNVEYRPKTFLRDRAIGRLLIKGVDISQQMLRDGAAWHVSMDDSGQEMGEFAAYAAMETAAKNEKLGVWSISGLKPAWEFRTDQELAAKRREQNLYASRPTTSRASNNKARVKTSAPTNPAFGDVGALLNRYNPATGTGVLSTSFIPITSEKTIADTESIAVDISYYYKEKGPKNRTGSFVVTAVFVSRNAIFPSGADLVLLDEDKKTVIGKVKRTVAYQNYLVRETMACEISRSTLERVAMNEGIMLKMGQHMIYMTGARYLLYNLLQVTA